MHVGVLGGGAWGTALAAMAAAGGRVTLWAREPEVVEAINAERRNPLFLPGVELPDGVEATGEAGDLAHCDAVLVVVPAQYLRGALERAGLGSRPLVLCAKGIEAGTGKLVTEVAAEAATGAPVAVLSGPTFAAEVARGLPTAATLACAEGGLAARLTERLALPHFRLYASDDPVGAEVGGAVKNVLAIACGVVVGRALGESARAAVISRGFAEMVRYAAARGGRAETLAGLSGLGDLVLTCSSTQSRNMSLGVALGEGRRAAEVLGERRSVAEGAATAPVLLEDARRRGVEMPIVEAVADLLGGRGEVGAIVQRLLERPLRAET